MQLSREFLFLYRRIFDFVKIYCRHQLIPTKGRVENSFVQIIDGTIYHGGLADRFNSIITSYAIAKANGAYYRLLHVEPFTLENYLVSNEHDWTPRNICTSIWKVNIVRFKKLVLLKPMKLNTRKQTHAYIHTNTLESVNRVYGKEYVYGELFRELFKPSEHLQRRIDHNMAKLPHDYEAVVFRFQSLLGDFYEGPFSAYEEREQEELIDSCMRYLQTKTSNKRLLVTSDSNKFLKRASKLTNICTIDGDRVHMEYTKGTFDSNETPFVDFYMLAGSRKITLVVAKDMYKSGFPKVAALVGGIDYEIVYL